MSDTSGLPPRPAEPQFQPVINAHSWSTFLGGSKMREKTLDAMRVAGLQYQDVFAMQARLGDRLAQLTRNESAYIANGASAALAIGLFALMSEGDTKALGHLSRAPGAFNVIIQRKQRNPYDAVVNLVGATLREIGDDNGATRDELVEVVDAGALAYLFVPVREDSPNRLTLEEVVAVCRPRGVPVLVDAAAQLPPASNLWSYTVEAGADAAVFSGGKELRGPQNSGFLVGRGQLVEACRRIGPPHQTIVRALKVSPEVMAGLISAVEDYLNEDESLRIVRREEIVGMWVTTWNSIQGVTATRDFPNVAGQPTPRAHLRINRKLIDLSADELANRLWHYDHIAVMGDGDDIFVNPSPLDDSEAETVRDRVAFHLKHPQTYVSPTPSRPAE